MTPDERLTELEIKLSFQERWMSELDEVVRGLRDQIDALRAEVRQLADHVRPESAPVVDEKPPHY